MLRRTFLAGLAGTAALGAMDSFGTESEEQSVDVNATLEKIAALLREKKLVESAEFHKATDAKKAIVQWRWAHYQPAIDIELLPHVERVNRELYAAMDAARGVPDSGLKELMHEGLIKGREGELVDVYRKQRREIVRNLFTVTNPFGGSDTFPTEQEVTRQLNIFENLDTPVNQLVYYNGQPYTEKISALSHFGAGFIHSELNGVILVPAEDSTIYDNAHKAQFAGDPVAYERWIHAERDKHFVKVAAEAKSAIMHLLVGWGHVLTDDIEQYNLSSENDISHLVLTVPGVPIADAFVKAKEKKWQEEKERAEKELAKKKQAPPMRKFIDFE